MFKISKLNDIKLNQFKVNIVPLEVHSYNNGKKKIEKFEVPEFIITGTDDENKYVLSFRFNKKLENLYDIELNSFVGIEKYNDLYSSYLEINGVNDFDVVILGKIYRIINKTIVIQGFFIFDDNIIVDEEYVGKFEIEFDLDDYINKDEKSDI